MDGVDNINIDITDSGQLFNALSGYANIQELKSGEGPANKKQAAAPMPAFPKLPLV